MKNFYLEFKMPIVIISLLFLGLFVYTKLAGPIPFFINSVTTTKTDLFKADGQGQANAVPDQATINAGVTQQAVTVADAQNKVNQKTQKIITALKSFGIPEKDIKTNNYSVSPNYGNNTGIQPMVYPPINTGNQTITSYTVTQNLEITVKDLTKVNKTIDTATLNGANIVNGASFNFSNELLSKLEDQARKEAVNKAKQKAQSLANAAGITLGKIINVTESSNYPVRYQSLQASIDAPKTDQTQTPTNVTPGENLVTVVVTIYYQTY